jgi:hypothetical protein
VAEPESAWQDYRSAVAASGLSESSQATYIDMAKQLLAVAARRFRSGLSQSSEVEAIDRLAEQERRTRGNVIRLLLEDALKQRQKR